MLFHLGMLVIVPSVALLAGVLLPAFAGLKMGEVSVSYALGVGAGLLGVLLLFIARLPLYRARRSWTIDPRQLDRKHRLYYWVASVTVTISLLLLCMVWLRTS